MTQTVKARYSHGRIEPLEPLQLDEGMPLVVTVTYDAEGSQEQSRTLATARSGREVWNEFTREQATLGLWESGSLSTRQAAEILGISYVEFMDLLADKGIPIEQGDLDLDLIEDAERKLSGGHS